MYRELTLYSTSQIYLEVPRARVTRQLATIREAEGDVTQASDLLQDLQVETFGSMERREKVDFILEQMRLLKLLGDWDKLGIVAKRINIKWLAEKDHEVRCYGYPSTLCSARADLLSLARRCRTSSSATTPS